MSHQKINLKEVAIDVALAVKMPTAIAKRQCGILFANLNKTLYIVAAEETASEVAYAFRRYLPAHEKVEVKIANREDIENELNIIYGSEYNPPLDFGEETAAVRMVDDILNAALAANASDIHLNPSEDQAFCKFRIDGSINEHLNYPIEEHSKLISRIKILADLNISERRLPQDGKFIYNSLTSTRPVDVRVATIPTKYGEKITLRLIGAHELPDDYTALGFSDYYLPIIENSLNQTQGLILVTGPTGSGKSTTLYTFLKKLKEREDLSLISLEDPVEYELEGVTQVSIDHKNTSFSVALRSVLRHDPDVILVGEIRDADTAAIAVRAALTGHLVLSTLHTNTAATVPQRLVDMGVPAYLVASTLNLVISQRLVRKLCPYCLVSSESHQCSTIDEKQTQREQEAFGKTYNTIGCFYCKGSGYKGRSGIYEFFENTKETATLIASSCNDLELENHLREKNITSMFENAKEKVNKGEVEAKSTLRVLGNLISKL